MTMPLVYAHRGASAYAPENTLSAFALAADQHADGVELDVQLTRDGQLIVLHDETLDRVTPEHGFVCQRTWEEVRRIPVTLWQSRGVTERIPLLQEVLTLLHARGLCVNIELKNSEVPYPGMEEKVLDCVAKTGMTGNVLYSSFNHCSMARMKRLDPSVRCGLLTADVQVDPWQYAAQHGMDALHPSYLALRMQPEVPARAHALGIAVNPWTVNEDADLRHMLAIGCDSVITNCPDRARWLIDGQKRQK